MAVSEEMYAEGMVDDSIPSHPHAQDIVSSGWGSYFYYPLPTRPKVTATRAGSAYLQKAQSFEASSVTGVNSSTNQLPPRAPSVQNEEMKRAITLRRVSSMKTAGDAMEAASLAAAGFAAAAADGRGGASSALQQRQRRSGSHCASYSTNVSEPPSRGSTPSIGSLNTNPVAATANATTDTKGFGGQVTSAGLPGYGLATMCIPQGASNTATTNPEENVVPKGPRRINTLWGTYVRDYAKMCIPDVDVLCDYPIDYEFPVFCRDKNGNVIESGFFPSDPISLHQDPPHFIHLSSRGSNSQINNTMSTNVSNTHHSKTSNPPPTSSDSSNNNNNTNNVGGGEKPTIE